MFSKKWRHFFNDVRGGSNLFAHKFVFETKS